MEDYSKAFDKTTKLRSDSTPSEKSRKWHLLVIGEKGKVISFRRLKGVFLALIFTLILSLLASFYIGFLYTRNKMEIGSLKEKILTLEEKETTFKEEKELLMARIVIAESKLKANSKSAKKTALEEKKESDVLKETSMVASAQQPKKKTTQKPAAVLKKKSTPLPEKSKLPVKMSMTVKQFEIGEVYQKNRVWVKFVIRNTTPGRPPVLGRCVVLLKTDGDDPETWITLPKIPLDDGKPSGRYGWYFKIANFKPFRLKTKVLTPPVKFVEATIYVFSAKGKTLFEDDYPIDITIKAPLAVPVEEKKKMVEEMPAPSEKTLESPINQDPLNAPEETPESENSGTPSPPEDSTPPVMNHTTLNSTKAPIAPQVPEVQDVPYVPFVPGTSKGSGREFTPGL